jgi:hypothetical protein
MKLLMILKFRKNSHPDEYTNDDDKVKKVVRYDSPGFPHILGGVHNKTCTR